jgi:inosine-uridine nucleoside N-ribohydrolase
MALFLTSTYNKILSLDSSLDPATIGLQLHDPLTIWYCLCPDDPLWKFTSDEDIRVETLGQWTRGTCVVDRRGRSVKEGAESLDEEVVGDAGGWRDSRRGNRLERCTRSPGVDLFASVLLERVLGNI